MIGACLPESETTSPCGWGNNLLSHATAKHEQRKRRKPPKGPTAPQPARLATRRRVRRLVFSGVGVGLRPTERISPGGHIHRGPIMPSEAPALADTLALVERLGQEIQDLRAAVAE